MGCTPFSAKVLLTIASCQGNSESFFWLSLGVVVDHGRVVSFASSLGTSFGSVGLFSNCQEYLLSVPAET